MKIRITGGSVIRKNLWQLQAGKITLKIPAMPVNCHLHNLTGIPTAQLKKSQGCTALSAFWMMMTLLARQGLSGCRQACFRRQVP